jgi:hypothetical protein
MAPYYSEPGVMDLVFSRSQTPVTRVGMVYQVRERGREGKRSVRVLSEIGSRP